MERKMFLDAGKNTFQTAGQLRSNMTPAEIILWKYFRLKPSGLKFRRQHAISKYVADFYCHSLKLIIEVDGGIHNVETVGKRDIIRQEYLESEGLKFLRFTNDDILNNFESVISKIEKYIADNIDK